MKEEKPLEQVFSEEINAADKEEKKGKTYAEIQEDKKRKEAREELFADLLTDVLRLYKAAKEKYPEKEKSQVHEIPFYFKKIWDAFGEAAFEYDDLKKQIEDAENVSSSERKRRLHDLEEKKKEANMLLAGLKPARFDTFSEAKVKAWFHQLYRQFAKEVEDDKDDLERDYFNKESYLSQGQPLVTHRRWPDSENRYTHRQWFNEDI